MIDLIAIILHLDVYLGSLIQEYGLFVYAILFIILFLETGLVVTPFFPGDSLLFAAGAFAALGILNPLWLFVVMAAGAIIGDTVNYWIGHKYGEKILRKHLKIINEDHIKKTNEFYHRHGGKTIMLARFLPFIRTFAPFVAGIGTMKYKKFIAYNIAGGLVWIAAFLSLGYFFGNVPLIKDNFGLFVMGIIIVTIIPAVVGIIRHIMRKKHA